MGDKPDQQKFLVYELAAIFLSLRRLRQCRRADANACQSILPTIFVISAAEKARTVHNRRPGESAGPFDSRVDTPPDRRDRCRTGRGLQLEFHEGDGDNRFT
jgi:hypothetical protein